MRLIKPYTCYKNFTKLSDHVLAQNSFLRPNQRCPSTVMASLVNSEGFRTKPPTSELPPSSPYNIILRANKKNPISVSASLGNMSNGLVSMRYMSIGLGGTSFRAYSSFFGGKGDNTSSVVKGMSDSSSNGSGSEGVDGLKKAWQSIVDVADYIGEKAKETSDALTPHAQQLLDSHPGLKNVIIPVGWTLIGTLLAWLVLPKVLRKLHKYSMQGPVALIYRNSPEAQVPYEKSVWGALEDPVRYLVTFMAFSQLGVMIAPTTIASQYIPQAWRGAVILSFVWFIHRWKSNVFTGVLSAQKLGVIDRERMLTLDKLSSVGISVLGLMALAESMGVAVQSILTIGGIGGIATAFAAKDILGNVLSGLFMQFSKPFSLGDTIRAGSIEGKVVEMGLTTTSLLNAEKFPVTVPNSLISGQGIVNKSRAQYRAMVNKIPIRTDKLDIIPQISDEITSMLKSNSKIFLGEDVPYCLLSQIGTSYAELTVGYNLRQMSKYELYSAEQDVLLQAFRIIKEHGASVQDLTYQ